MQKPQKSQKRAAQRGAERAEAALFAYHNDDRRAYRASVRLLVPVLCEGCAVEGAGEVRSALLLSSEEEEDEEEEGEEDTAAALAELLLRLVGQQRDSSS